MKTSDERAFTPLEKFAGHTGTWRRIGLVPRLYELEFDGQLAARLTVRVGRQTSHLVAAGGAWDIVRPSIWSSALAVLRAGQDAALAEYEPNNWLGFLYSGTGTLQFDSGARFAWRKLDFWAGRHAFVDDHGIPLLTMTPRWLMHRRGRELTLAPEAARVTALPVLAGLALRLRLPGSHAH